MPSPATLLGVDLDPGRVAQVALGDPRDRRRDRGREERGLAIVGGRGEDRLEVLGEAHVEHLVGLVEDDHLDAIEAQAAALEVVDRPAGCRDDDVDAAPQAAQLLADRLAAVDRQDPGAELAAVLVERLGDLHRQLARRDQDERRRAALAGLPDGDALEGRQRERGRLAGARSGPRRGGRGRRAAAGWPRAGSASALRSRAPRSSSAAAGRARARRSRRCADSAGRRPSASRASRRRGSRSRCRLLRFATSAIVAESAGLSVPRRSGRGRSSGRGGSRPRRSAPRPSG